LEESPNARINKTLLDRYSSLELPDGKIIATYIWIDGSNENLRCKDRTLDFIPTKPSGEFNNIYLRGDKMISDFLAKENFQTKAVYYEH
jgi:hypothetical protein